MNFKLWLEAAKKLDIDDVQSFADKLAIDFDKIVKKYGKKELVDGVNTEMEHQSNKEKLNVVGKSVEKTLQIALAHLEEDPNYYKKLSKMEKKP